MSNMLVYNFIYEFLAIFHLFGFNSVKFLWLNNDADLFLEGVQGGVVYFFVTSLC